MSAEFKRLVQSSQRGTRVEAFEVEGVAPSIIIGASRAALTDTGVGDQLLTFTEQFERTPVVVATSYDADLIVTVGTRSSTAVQILCFDATDGTTPKDGEYSVLVIGFDTEDEH